MPPKPPRFPLCPPFPKPPFPKPPRPLPPPPPFLKPPPFPKPPPPLPNCGSGAANTSAHTKRMANIKI